MLRYGRFICCYARGRHYSGRRVDGKITTGVATHREQIICGGGVLELDIPAAFYTETSMQWEDTNFWYYHMWLTFALASWSEFILLIFTRYLSPSTRRHYLNKLGMATICLATIPAFTALFFVIGKYSLFPPHGVFKMSKCGCRTQALLFPRTEIPKLAPYLKDRGHGQTDAMIEDCSDKTGKQRLALAPQQVQHVGLRSIRDNTFVNSQRTWAFWFETNDWMKLRKEHKKLTKGV